MNKKAEELLKILSAENGVVVAGIDVDKNGNLVTSAGRVLNVVMTGKNLKEARKNTYKKIKQIGKKVDLSAFYYRTDIGLEIRKKNIFERIWNKLKS